MEIYKEFMIEAAHQLPLVPRGHKCGRLHGHSWKITVGVEGPVQDTGFVVDYADIKKAFAPLYDQLDHRYLNEVQGLENPTSEVLAQWVWDHLVDALPCLSYITINETCTSGCTYRG